MESPSSPLIPEKKAEAVKKALFATFGVEAPDTIEVLTGGMSSALVYKITIKETPYAMRIVVNANAFNNLARQLECLRLAADAGIAPKLFYTNVEDAISISAFISAVDWEEFFGEDGRVISIAKIIKSIHSLPPFPKFISFLERFEFLLTNFKLAKTLPEEIFAEPLAYYDRIRRVYPNDPDMVPCHYDFNPNNVLYDGKKIWVIDWENASQGDRFVDLATAANLFFINGDEEEIFLHEYFGDKVTDYIRARFFLMRQACYLYYAALIFHIANIQKAPSAENAIPDVPLAEIIKKMMAKETPTGPPNDKMKIFAKALVREMLQQSKTERFEKAIALMG